jgi:hypothetical protein
LPESVHQRRVTRRQLLQAGGGLAGVAAVGGATLAGLNLSRRSGGRTIHSRPVEAHGVVRVFHSRPDLRPPTVTVDGGGSVAPGNLFLGPGGTKVSQAGPLILDGDGEPVWFKPLKRGLWESNFRPWNYRGQPVLAWWEGILIVPPGYGHGEAVIVNRSYRELARVRAAGGMRMDVHELQLTPEGTALFTCYPASVPMDLSGLGGHRHGHVLDSVIQEVDIASGRLLFEWRALDHIPVADSYRPIEEPYDYIHVNSIDVAPDGNLIISARHTFALYKIDRRTGAVIWQLGGKRSDFQMGEGSKFSFQHDARRISERVFTVFDDGTDGPTRTERQSRAIVLDVDMDARTVELIRAYQHPKPPISSVAMGSVQMLADGHVLVGWGSQPWTSEFAADGTMVADAKMPKGQQSYRAYRFPWRGAPHEGPAVHADRDPDSGRPTVYASWNGATDVTRWELRAGPTPSRLKFVGIAERRGFETAIPVPAHHRYVAVTALDGSGRPLADSDPVPLQRRA